ncbi:MAG: L-rhamnose mutarotase [Candidatus Promineifilaceae bacterium]|jgi:L-rhamnose mutarotase
MKRVGFSFKVRADKLAEYKEHHQNVWPEMLAALQETGWHNYTLFVRDDGLVFGYFETPHSLSEAQLLMAAKDVNSRWQEFMAPFMEANARPDELFQEWEEVFHLE